MKTKKTVKTAIVFLAALVCGCMSCGCGAPRQDIHKYVVFEGLFSAGTEKYVVSDPDEEFIKVEYEYDVSQLYVFEYKVYYSANDEPTGQRGYSQRIYANKPGVYDVTVDVRVGYEKRVFGLRVIIKEKSVRVKPEVRFDPCSATVGERDGNKVFVYEHDGEEHYPRIGLYYNDREIPLALRNEGIYSIELNGENYDRDKRPREIGLYEIKYRIDGLQYADDGQDLYHGVDISVFVEIINELPDPRVKPEVRFDPRGATVEKRDGETVYVYKYDGYEHYPRIQLYHNDREIELQLPYDGIGLVEFDDWSVYHYKPSKVGIYNIKYCIYGNNYKDGEQDLYRCVTANVIVEIRERRAL